METVTITNKKVRVYSNGFVLGNYWGGGRGAYPSTKLEAPTKEELIEVAKKALVEGSLDSGMGYESLIGARLDIRTVTTIEIDGNEFVNTENETEFIGDLTDSQIEFLDNL